MASTVLEDEKEKTTSSLLNPADLLDLGDDIIGCKVVVKTRECLHIGVIQSMLINDRRILTLGKLTDPLTGKRRLGLRRLFFHDIINISVCGIDNAVREKYLKHAFQEDQRGKQLIMKKLAIPHLDNINNELTVVDEDILLGRAVQHGDGKKDYIISRGSVSHTMKEKDGHITDNDKEKKHLPPYSALPPPCHGISRPEKWIIIDKVDDAFSKAIKLISEETEISLGFEGEKIGRLGTLAWCNVATSKIIFLFDGAKIGAPELLKEGLADILTDENILKVIHDCRSIEDYLYHKFGISLKNIFDTQVAEIYLHIDNHHNSVPMFVSGLPSLLVRYLNLSPHHVFFSRVREECSQRDEMVWFERPLSENLCEGMARDVMFLRELRLALLQMMMTDFMQLTNIYLGSLRDKNTATATSVEPQLVPEEIRKLRRKNVTNYVDVHDPYIVYTRDVFKVRK
ncbi:hypothetical protein SK128_014467 [Halocaridina rubra]|uniref:3'-5' exonuclease domain-containing protein n=1 Tax=Halocaridina rubra TaxID=373956 RepID=A0AAN8WNF3_HALRR